MFIEFGKNILSGISKATLINKALDKVSSIEKGQQEQLVNAGEQSKELSGINKSTKEAYSTAKQTLSEQRNIYNYMKKDINDKLVKLTSTFTAPSPMPSNKEEGPTIDIPIVTGKFKKERGE